MITNISVILL